MSEQQVHCEHDAKLSSIFVKSDPGHNDPVDEEVLNLDGHSPPRSSAPIPFDCLSSEYNSLRPLLSFVSESDIYANICAAIDTGQSTWIAVPDPLPPITDIQILFADCDELLAEGYVQVGSAAPSTILPDINRRVGGRQIYLSVGRDPGAGPPITSLAVIHEDVQEEAPFGFNVIQHTQGGRVADLTFGSGGHHVFLCCQSGSGGPPITDLVLRFASRKEQCPPGYHEITRTPTTDPADLNGGRDQGHQVYLCFRLDLSSYMFRYIRDDCDSRLALIIACLFHHDENVVMQAISSLQEVLFSSSVNLSPHLLDLIFESIADSLILAQCQFARQVQSSCIQILLDGLIRYFMQLKLDTILRVYESCFFDRQSNSNGVGLALKIHEFFLDEMKRISGVGSNGPARASSAPLTIRVPLDEDEPFDVSAWIKDDVLGSLSETISIDLSSRLYVNRFQRARKFDALYRHDLASFIRRLLPRKHVEQCVIALMLTGCKVAMYPVAFRLGPRSESIRRNGHALTLLFSIVQDCAPHTQIKLFTQVGPLLILRRLLCTSLLQSCVTVVPGIFKLVLSIFSALWTGYHTLLKTELGIIMDAVLLSMLQCAHCWPEQKIDLIAALSALFPSSASLIDLFYNYDNDVHHRRPLFSRLCKVLCQLTEGKHNPDTARMMNVKATSNTMADKRGALPGISSVNSPPSVTNAALSTSGSGSPSGTGVPPSTLSGGTVGSGVHLFEQAFMLSAHEANASQANLQRNALQTIVHFLESLAQFVAPNTMDATAETSDGLAREISVVNDQLLPLSPQAPQAVHVMQFPTADISSSITPHGATNFTAMFNDLQLTSRSSSSHRRAQSFCNPVTNGGAGVNLTPVDDEKNQAARDKRLRSSTWVTRHNQQKRAQSLHAEAVAVARSDSLKAAINLLIDRRGSFVPEEIAQFLSTNSSVLDRAEIGEFIAADFNRTMSAKQLIELREAYLALIDFTSMDLDGALRHFLIHSGFRLPGESQKVDRLIQAFADAYVRDNPGLYESPEGVLLVAFALIMLNTDIHDPRLRTGKHRRAPMTKAQFIRNVQGAESVGQLSATILGQLFDSIAAHAIEWLPASSHTAADLKGSTSGNGTQQESPSSYHQAAASPEATEKLFRMDCELYCRQGLAWMRSASIRNRMHLTTLSKHIVKGMFELIFPALLVSLSSVLDDENIDIDQRTLAVDGLKFASVIALAANAQDELQAFMNVLAKVTYVERHKSSLTGPTIRRNLVSGEHLMQEWVVELQELVASRSKRAITALISVSDRTQRRLCWEREQSILQNIQTEFTDDIYLVDSDRIFIRDGHLTKVSSGLKLQIYRFFLFSDLLLYAREQFAKLKLHKVVHLSLCRLVDLSDDPTRKLKYAFKLVSPQKSFIVVAPSIEEKIAWIHDIQQQITESYVRHQKWVEATRCSSDQPDPTRSVSELASSRDDLPDIPMDDVTMLSATSLSSMLQMSQLIGRRGLGHSAKHRGCKLCIRDFSFLRKKCICSWCSQSVCSSCSTHRLDLPTIPAADTALPDAPTLPDVSIAKKPQRVCDACYGFLTGCITDESPRVTHE